MNDKQELNMEEMVGRAAGGYCHWGRAAIGEGSTVLLFMCFFCKKGE